MFPLGERKNLASLASAGEATVSVRAMLRRRERRMGRYYTRRAAVHTPGILADASTRPIIKAGGKPVIGGSGMTTLGRAGRPCRCWPRAARSPMDVASGHNGDMKRAAHPPGCMAAFAKSWRIGSKSLVVFVQRDVSIQQQFG